jgi:formiminoglutamase
LAALPVQRSITCYDFGDVACLDQDLEAAQCALAEIVASLLQRHVVPIVLGGGHEMAWGHFQGIVKQAASGPVGAINFDAHLDMRPLLANNKGTSGTPFLQIAQAQHRMHQSCYYHCIGIQRAANTQALFDAAKRHNARILYADDIQQSPPASYAQFIERALTDCPFSYVSICLDVFASAYAPGVSAPQALGITPWQAIFILRKLASSGKIISYDIAELSPRHDVDARTAKLAANLVYEIIHHHQKQ